MKDTKEYGGIDCARIIAALLIVAIHTSPLISLHETADFILTRVIARVAVPFFFMTTGFFLYLNSRNLKERLRSFCKKTGILYGAAILLYLPLNIYSNYFDKEDLLYHIIKDILFDGTMYHLWYLPAVILGVILVTFLIRRLSLRGTFWISAILYLFGVFGDSYYGITSKSVAARELYEIIFLISDYTRNGISFAPIFIVLGAIAAKNQKQVKFMNNFIGFLISFSLMLTEALTLRGFQLMRHDSMYLMLVPSMYFLFSILLLWKGPGRKEFRSSSMLIYLIHPMMIVMVRAAAKLFRLQAVLIDNSMIHFVVVALGSGIMAASVSFLHSLLHRNIASRKRDIINKKTSRSWIEVNLQNLQHNAKELKKYIPNDCELMAVVKADAYGHGAVRVSKCLNEIGVKAFAVATIDEGIELRKKGVKGDILILGYTDITRVVQLIRYRFIQTVIDYEYALMLNRYNKSIQVHVKIDTGMHRLGIPVEEVNKITEVFYLEHLKVSGIYTHLCVADSLAKDAVKYTNEQIERFYQLLKQLENRGITLPKVHIQSSYGLLNYPDLHCDYARIGIALYGSLSSQGDRTKLQLSLRPVMTLKSRVAMIREVAAGEGVSYGRDILVEKNSRIAVLPIGYADGLPRNLSFQSGSILIHGTRAPIIGKICMDQLLIDITDLPNVKPGDIATLMGSDGQEEIAATSIAKKAGTITNELLSRLSSRMERVYI